MYLKCIIFFTLLYCSSSSAKNISVKYGIKKYQLLLKEDKISIKANLLDISLTKKKCNEEIYNRFNSGLETKLSGLKDEGQQEKSHLMIKVNGISKDYQKESKLEEYFMSIPREFKRLKIESQLLCRK